MADVMTSASFHVKDGDGEATSTPLWKTYADTTPLATVIGTAQTLAGLIDAVLDGKVFKVRICLEFEPTGVKSDPVAGSEIERTGLLQFDTAALLRNFGLDLPAYAAAEFVGNVIPVLGNGPSNTLATTLVSGGWSDAYGNDLTAILSGRKTFRKHRRQTRRT